VLDDEVRVDEVEAAVVERQATLEVGRYEVIEVRVLATCGLVAVEPDQPHDAVAIEPQPRRATAARVEDDGTRPERVVQEPPLDERVVRLHAPLIPERDPAVRTRL